MTNRLADEASPYLLQHKDNPVDWRPWGSEALAEAAGRAKPILLSVGYAACHWCHVMAHESFENPAIAALMNELFVNIKVDREERPDIDQIYQAALALLGQSGGWPLTMFLTPKGEPFWGGTYFPPEPRWGRPGFPEILRSVATAYRSAPEKVDNNRRALTVALADMARKGDPRAIDLELVDQAARALLSTVDLANGGLGAAPKFPQVAGFEALWRAWLRTGDDAFKVASLVTADRMCQGGIYDHVGGGFARYSVDDRWLVPHFEKMLYDNALLVGWLTELARETGSRLYAARVAETIEWALREMRLAEGGFASSLDADSEGEEGRFYVWTEAEIDRVLGPAAALFKLHYDVDAEGNWEGHTILNRGRSALGDEALETQLARMRADLLGARAARVRPGFDDKVLADWNGLMIAALAEAAFAWQRPDWLEAARAAFAFVAGPMSLPDGRLRHATRDGRFVAMAVLDDYAAMARAALTLHEITDEPDYLERAKAWVTVADRDYADPNGGYFLTARDAEALIVRTKSAVDSPCPSGNGLMAINHARLYHLTGEDAHRARAAATLAAFGTEARKNVYGLSTLFNAAETLERAIQVVIVGHRADAGTQALLRAVAGVSVPARVLQVVAPGATLPATHPALGKGQVGKRPTAYVCVGPTCSLPVAEPNVLAEALRTARRAGD
ncbi:MAG: thioredoxin domain-containing protein [Alphaproteobacteria bacterium]|nr:thioredoxin domain-containing protein [Alphaproteobacteria bacterium]